MAKERDLPSVVPRRVGGVTIHRNVLEEESIRLCRLSARVGKRLRYTFALLGEAELPPPEWADQYRLYAGTIIALLREQRERNRVVADLPQISDEQFEEELANLARTQISRMSPDELEALLAQHKAGEK